MLVLFLLEPGVVIYRNVIFPALPPHLCQRPRDQQISIYCCPGAHSNETPVYITVYKPCSSSWSGWELLPLWKLGEKEREREVTDFSFPGRGRSGNLTWTHITSHQINKIWSSHPAQLIAEEINRLLDQKSEAWIQTNQYLSSSSYICKMEVSLWSHTRYKGFWKE